MPRSSYCPQIIAHRGARDVAPENTRAALDAALRASADGIEFDVQLTKDEVAVLYHDRTLNKVSGRRRRIGDCTLKELRKLDFGSWKSADFAGEPIMTLDSVLQNYASRCKLMIEIKSRPRDRLDGRSERLASQVLELLDERVAKVDHQNVNILSYDAKLLEFAMRTDPGWRYYLNTDTPEELCNVRPPCYDDLTGICLPIKKLSAAVVSAAEAAGKQVMTFTCNTRSQVRKAMGLRVSAIITDKPAWLVEYLPGLSET